MDLQQLNAIAFAEMGQQRAYEAREPGYTYYHGVRTARIALQLADTLRAELNRDVLYAGALFHDVGRGNGRHNEIGAERVRTLLAGICTRAELAQISQIVRQHNRRKQPNRYDLTTRIVQDADIVDHVGAVGVWVNLYEKANHDATVLDALRVFLNGELAQVREEMRSQLNLGVSVKLYDQRLAFEQEFYAALARSTMGAN